MPVSVGFWRSMWDLPAQRAHERRLKDYSHERENISTLPSRCEILQCDTFHFLASCNNGKCPSGCVSPIHVPSRSPRDPMASVIRSAPSAVAFENIKPIVHGTIAHRAPQLLFSSAPEATLAAETRERRLVKTLPRFITLRGNENSG